MNKRHEMLLFRYSSALERGDFESVAAVLRDAEHDPTLEAMIVEMNDAYAVEQTERFNHTNHKEIPMLAPLYENRTRSNTRFQSLLLIAAVTLVAVMSIIMMTQMRGNNIFNTGQPNTAGMVAQNEPLCEAVTRTSVNVLSLPSTTNGVVVGTIPEGAVVQVLDQSYFINERDNVQILWYFIAASGVQGWTSPGRLDTSECPANSVALATPTPLLPTMVPPYEVLTTFTPSPFVSEPTVVPPEGWIPTEVPMLVPEASANASNFPVYIVETGDTLLSILNKFGLDASVMPDLSIVNQLPEGAALTPGQAILLPYAMPDLVTTCTVTAEQGMNVWAEPANSPNSHITTLPAGASFEIAGETEAAAEIWLPVSAQVGSVTISGAWVRLAEMDFATECRSDFVPMVGAVAVLPTPTLDLLALVDNTLDGNSCTVTAQNVVDVQSEASSTSPVREQLPAGTPIAIIAVTQQADGAWYMVTYRSRTGAGMWWGYISTDMLDVPSDCEYWGSQLIPDSMLVVGTATPVPLMTATPLPTFTPTPAA